MANTDPPSLPMAPLEVVAKRAFPFTLACPSFIYRAGYAENVRLLAPFVDEVQLLFFESRRSDSLPSRVLIRDLARLGREADVTFSVHLPSDVFLGHRDVDERRRAVAVLTELIARCEPLDATTFTLHLERDASEPDDARWQRHTRVSLEAVLAAGVAGRRISVENLDYDFSLAAPVVEALDLSVCMDMGHLLARGDGLGGFFERWRERIGVVHLHGVDAATDHLPLDRLAPASMTEVLRLLKPFTGVVSLEVYSAAALNASLRHLKEEWRRSHAGG